MAEVAKQPSKLWIASPRADLSWIILCPLISLGVLWAAWRWLGISDQRLYVVMFSFIVIGHHMPAWLRAFGEPAVYQRYKARLWVSVLCLPFLIIVPTAFGFGMFAICVAAFFDLWHVAMQQHGIGRIYGAKAGDLQARSARLDHVCVLVWYASVVIWSDALMAGLSQALRKAGIPVFDLFGPASWQLVRIGFGVVSLGLFVLYMAHGAALWRRHKIWPWRKYLIHLVGFAVLAISYQDASWYRAQSTQNIFHAMQYFFLVWIYGHLAIKRSSQHHPFFYTALFQHRRGILRFVFLIALYGFFFYILGNFSFGLHAGVLKTADIPLLPASWSAQRGIQVLGSIAVTSLLLHFYADAFIWKVRSRPVRKTLDIEGSSSSAFVDESPESIGRGAAHALAYFGIPLVLFAAVGLFASQRSNTQRLRELAHDRALFPRSAILHTNYGKAARKAGQLPLAKAAFRRAVALSPSLHGPAVALFSITREQKKPKESMRWGLLALQARPEDAKLQHQVALTLIDNRRFEEARRHVRLALRWRRGYIPYLLTLQRIEGLLGHHKRALRILQLAHRIAPRHPKVCLHLAKALHKARKTRQARKILSSHLARFPKDSQAQQLMRLLQ